MNLFSLLLFLAFINFIYLGISSFLLDRKSWINRTMLGLCFCLAIWALSYGCMHITEDREIAAIWYRLSVLGWGVFPSVAIHILLLWSKNERFINKYSLSVIYFLAAFALFIANYLVISPDILKRVPYGWVAVYDIASSNFALLMAFMVVYIGFMATGLAAMFLWGRRAKLKREKRQAAIIIITSLFALALSSTFDNILPIMKIIKFPLMAPVFTMIWATGMWYAIKRYRFLSLSASIAANEIIANMNDLLVMVDHDGTIIHTNPHTCRLLETGESDIIGKTMYDIVNEEEAIRNEFQLFNESNYSYSSIEVNYKTVSGELIPVKLSGSVLRDRDGDLLGIVFVGYDLRDTRKLESMNTQLKETNEKLEEMRRIAERDMEMASYVQSHLFPEESPKTAEWEISHVFKPMVSVSGDFFDYYTDNGELEGAALFDVSGHGISSGLVTMIAKSIIFRNFSTLKDSPLNEVLEHANKELVNEIGHIDNYVTGILLRFREGRVEYVNAGHTELLCRRASSGNVAVVNREDDDIKGFFLGVSEMESKYSKLSIKISSGDLLFIYSDCILESMNEEKEDYGIKRLAKALKEAPEGTTEEILNYIVDDLQRFIGDKPFNDDLTAILLKKK